MASRCSTSATTLSRSTRTQPTHAGRLRSPWRLELVMINADWHRRYRMPMGSTISQRVRWHVAHAKACGCRPIPPTVPEGIAPARQEAAAAARRFHLAQAADVIAPAAGEFFIAGRSGMELMAREAKLRLEMEWIPDKITVSDRDTLRGLTQFPRTAVLVSLKPLNANEIERTARKSLTCAIISGDCS